jgi:hypothetical protein
MVLDTIPITHSLWLCLHCTTEHLITVPNVPFKYEDPFYHLKLYLADIKSTRTYKISQTIQKCIILKVKNPSLCCLLRSPLVTIAFVNSWTIFYLSDNSLLLANIAKSKPLTKHFTVCCAV